MASASEWSVASWLVSEGRPDGPGQPLNTPLVPASTFINGGDFGYARDDGTPTWVALEQLMGRLEGGTALAFASGMAAVAAVFELLPVGAHIVWPDDCYQGVAGVVTAGERQGRWTSRRIPVADTVQWVDAAASADLIWIESPSNPLLSIADLPAIASASRRTGSILAVDNTLATPLNQRPLAVGADISMTSATKFIGGHSDLLCGITVCGDDELATRIAEVRLLHGATPGNLEAYLAVRGLRTLALRMERAQANAVDLAARLVDHPAVGSVRYPGMPAHPQHELAARLLDGFGTIVSFDVNGGARAADSFLSQVRLIVHATSFGSVESTIERRSAIPGQEHLPAGLVRMNVGIEDVEDL